MIFKLYYLPCDRDSGVQVRKYISSENIGIGKELVVNEICCMERAPTILNLQVRETLTGTILRESAEFFFTPGPQHMQVGEGFLGIQSFLWVC